MTSTLVGLLVLGGFAVAIWLSYRFFMRGFTAEERVAALLPSDFKPDLSLRTGDTYVGYEKKSNRLAIVDWPHAAVVSPRQVEAIEPADESVLGVVHRWLVIRLREGEPRQLRLWFRFSTRRRDEWRERLMELCRAG